MKPPCDLTEPMPKLAAMQLDAALGSFITGATVLMRGTDEDSLKAAAQACIDATDEAVGHRSLNAPLTWGDYRTLFRVYTKKAAEILGQPPMPNEVKEAVKAIRRMIERNDTHRGAFEYNARILVDFIEGTKSDET